MLEKSRYSGPARNIAVLLVLFSIALLVRLIFAFAIYPHLAGPLELGFDPDEFGVLARNWVDGKGYRFDVGSGELTTDRGPGLPLVLAASYALSGNMFPSAVVVQAIISALTVPVVFKTGEYVYGSKVGIAAAIITTFHPLLIWYTPRLRYEVLLTLLTVLAVYHTIRLLDSGHRKEALLTGVFSGLATLVSQVFIFLPLLLSAALVFYARNRILMAKRVGLALLAMSLIIAPWTIRNYQVTHGRFIPVQTGGAMEFVRGIYFVQSYHEAPLRVNEVDRLANVHVRELLGGRVSGYRGDRDREEALLPFAVAHIRDHPGTLLKSMIVQTPRFWYLSASPLKSWFLIVVQSPFLCLALVGLVHSLRANKHGGLLIFLSVAYYNLIYSAFHAKARFSTPVTPCVIILAVAGLVAVHQFVVHAAGNPGRHSSGNSS